MSVAVAPRTLIDSDNGVRQKGLSIQHQKRLLMAYFVINMMRLTIGLSERCQLIAVSMRGMICTCRLAIHPAIKRANRNGIGVQKGGSSLLPVDDHLPYCRCAAKARCAALASTNRRETVVIVDAENCSGTLGPLYPAALR